MASHDSKPNFCRVRQFVRLRGGVWPNRRDSLFWAAELLFIGNRRHSAARNKTLQNRRNGIYQSAVYAYGKTLLPDPVDAKRFVNVTWLNPLKQSGAYADQKPAISPLRSGVRHGCRGQPSSQQHPLFLEPNSGVLDMNQPANLERLASIDKLLQVSPGSTVLLRGHVDDAMVPEFDRFNSRC